MTGKILLIMIVLIGLVSGCIENGVQVDNNTTDAFANVSDNVTANASEQDRTEGMSVSIPLERPPFIEDR